MDRELERVNNVALSVGLIMGAIHSADIKRYFTAREVSDTDLDKAYDALMVLAKAFYREPK